VADRRGARLGRALGQRLKCAAASSVTPESRGEEERKVKRRTGFFPYVLGVIWAAFVVFALVEMANFSATFAQQPAPRVAPAPVVQAHTVRRSM
jgi:hypothetical protein